MRLLTLTPSDTSSGITATLDPAVFSNPLPEIPLLQQYPKNLAVPQAREEIEAPGGR